MAQRLQNRDLSYEVNQCTADIKACRFIVLGGNEVLMREVCETILGTKANITEHGSCELREAHDSGRHISVVKTPTNWLERLKTHPFLSHQVKSLKIEMDCSSLLIFPGPHAFLLVLGDVHNTGKEHYLLRALRDAFGEEVLNYTMVVFMHEYEEEDIKMNRCVKKCHERYHILKNSEDSVIKLFQDATKTIKKRMRNLFFTKDRSMLEKAEMYFTQEYISEYEEFKTTEEGLRIKVTEMENQISENLKDSQRLREELQASKSRENQLNQQMDALKKEKSELEEELCALRYLKRLLENLTNERESQLKSDNEKLKQELEQLTANNQRQSQDSVAFLLTKTQHHKSQEQKEEQAPVQEHERLRDLTVREMKLDHREREMLPSCVPEDKTKPQEDCGSIVLEEKNVSEIKVKALSQTECEMENKRTVEMLKLTREGSKKVPVNMSKDKKKQGDTGSFVLEGLKLVGQNSGNQSTGHLHGSPKGPDSAYFES
ncbi:uncharacterized protein isoform X2 [Danio rerio]|uniref:Uncharacterized protein isoform X2 n=1 Tax=Danio rerio TaxID=7955 RepID=A0AC58IC01_DANRE